MITKGLRLCSMSWCLSHWHEYHLRKQASSGQLITAYTPYPYFHVHPQSPGIPSAALALSLNLAGGNVLIYCMKCHWQRGVLSSSCSNLQMHPLQTASDKHCSTGAGRSESMCGFFKASLAVWTEPLTRNVSRTASHLSTKIQTERWLWCCWCVRAGLSLVFFERMLRGFIGIFMGKKEHMLKMCGKRAHLSSLCGWSLILFLRGTGEE